MTSYDCVILQTVILHDAMKTIHNVVFVFFQKNKNLFHKKTDLKKGFSSTLTIFQSFFEIFP